MNQYSEAVNMWTDIFNNNCIKNEAHEVDMEYRENP